LLFTITPYIDTEILKSCKKNCAVPYYYRENINKTIKNPNYAFQLSIQEQNSKYIKYLAKHNYDGRFHLTPEIIEEIEKITQDENSPEELLQALSLFNPRQKSAMQMIEYKDEPAEELFEEFIEALPGNSLDIMPQLQ